MEIIVISKTMRLGFSKVVTTMTTATQVVGKFGCRDPAKMLGEWGGSALIEHVYSCQTSLCSPQHMEAMACG